LPCGLLLQALEIGVLDGDGPAAPLADHLTGLIPHGFIVRDAIALMNAPGNAGVVKMLDCPVDGRPADGTIHILDIGKQCLRADFLIATHKDFEYEHSLLCQLEVVLRKVLFKCG